ncbi:DUF1059 domain-containing protein [Natrinema sp. DC36]|uniref:DUF1059 domain-containing protein n=1 Tax=Natrinema sp. DC36 TaxID=2878680 RepID=UPI001CF080F2|nr:DUF1059 domain-containing protein [Natrinema sp. DC36]
MANDLQTEDRTTALQVACDTAVSGCVFRMRTEADDRERLLEITREHVKEQHGKTYSLEEIDEQHVEEVEVEIETGESNESKTGNG